MHLSLGLPDKLSDFDGTYSRYGLPVLGMLNRDIDKYCSSILGIAEVSIVQGTVF